MSDDKDKVKVKSQDQDQNKDKDKNKNNYIDRDLGKIKYAEELGPLKDRSACANSRANLKLCMLQTDCVKNGKMTPKECLRIKDPSIPDICYRYHIAFFECKRSIIDNRNRFRGRKGN